MRRSAMLASLGLFLVFAGCSLSSECRIAGPSGSAAKQTCASDILQRQNQLQNLRDASERRLGV
jgi:hypothetical protein